MCCTRGARVGVRSPRWREGLAKSGRVRAGVQIDAATTPCCCSRVRAGR